MCTQSLAATPSGYPQHASCPAVNQVSQELKHQGYKTQSSKRNLRPSFLKCYHQLAVVPLHTSLGIRYLYLDWNFTSKLDENMLVFSILIRVDHAAQVFSGSCNLA